MARGTARGKPRGGNGLPLFEGHKKVIGLRWEVRLMQVYYSEGKMGEVVHAGERGLGFYKRNGKQQREEIA